MYNRENYYKSALFIKRKLPSYIRQKVTGKVRSEQKKKTMDARQLAVDKAVKLAQVGKYFTLNEWININKSLDILLSILTPKE